VRISDCYIVTPKITLTLCIFITNFSSWEAFC